MRFSLRDCSESYRVGAPRFKCRRRFKVRLSGVARYDTYMMRFSLSMLLLVAPAAALGQSADEAFFEAKIRPVLAETCFKCHGGAKTSHDLRVDSREALLTGGENGPALKPGDPDGSMLLQAMRHSSGDLKMPPDRKLPDHVVADFAAWIKHGAVWPTGAAAKAGFTATTHWAFQPVK